MKKAVLFLLLLLPLARAVSKNGSVTYRANIVNTTLYVSPYTTANNTNLSKHYYAGTERLMTRTGRGTIANINDHLATAPDLTAKRFASRQLIQRTVNTCLNKTFTYQSNKLTYLRQNPTPSYATFYYHTDHLGSSAWITKANGAPQQYLTYLPFGETLYEKRANTTWNSLFTFSGKERDNETGYTYFGARYYSSNYGIWLSIDPMSDKYPAYSPYNYNLNNPVRYIDPTGEFPVETIWDIGNVLYDVGAAVYNHIKGDHKTARSHWGNAAFDAGAMLIPYVPAGTSKVVKAGASGAKALDRATDARKATRMTENAAKGKAFEKQVGESLGNNKASQVTIEAADGTRTKMDFVQKNDGKVTLTEAKGSQTAPLTKNQKVAHPQIETKGGTIRGNKGIEIGLPSGTKIPPTKVEIIRPEDLLKK